MFRIECTGIGNDPVEIFNSNRINELPVTEAAQNEQLNEAGSLRFTLVRGNPGYESLESMSCFVTAYENNNMLFYGRVLDAGKPTFSGTRTFECEGALTFLMDSEVTPNKNAVTRTAQEMFEWCIAQHNADIGNDPARTFEVGRVTVSEKNKSEKYQISSYTQTKTAIENNLLNVYGGYLRVRIEDGHRYIDWLEHYSSRVDQSPIVVGENVMEKAFSESGENLFTVLRPVGKNGLLLDTPTINIFPQELMNKYKRIVKSVSFSDADTKAKLQTRANEYIARLKASLLCTGTIKMVDMHYLDGTITRVHLGDRFTNIQGVEGTELTISSLERNFLQPYVGDLSLGNDKSLSEKSANSSGSISKGVSRNKSSTGQNFKHIIEIGDQVTINAETLYQHGQTLQQYYGMIDQQGSQISSLSTTVENYTDLVTDIGTRVGTIEGTGVIQNTELLTSFAGTMRLVKNLETGRIEGIQFVDGTWVMQDVNGQMVTVGKKIADNENGVQTIMGSDLWTEREGITGVCGEFDLVTDPQTHKTTLVIKSGGGMKIRRNNVEYGIYDNGNLTGGLIVDKINDDTVVTTIKGNRINLGTELTDQDLNTWAKNARDGTGTFAKYLTVKKLTAEQINTMFMDASLSHLEVVNTNHLVSNGSTLAGETWIGSGGQIGYMGDNTRYNLSNLIVSASVDPNTNTLTLQPLHGTPITFSKAASSGKFSVGWSGGIETIQTDPNGVEYVQYEFRKTDVDWASDKKSANVQVGVYRIAGASEYLEETLSFYVSATDSYNKGWNDARNVVNSNLPNAIGAYVDDVYKTIEIVVPNANGSSSNTTHVYTLTKNDSFTPSGSSSAIHVVELKEGSNVVARIDAQSFYTDGRSDGVAAGKDAVTLNDPAWTYDSDNVDANNRSANTVTVTTDGRPTQLSKQVSLQLTQSGWYNHEKTIYMRTGSSSGPYYAKLQVSALTEYNNGKADATLSGPTWTYSSSDVTTNNRSSNTVKVANASNANTYKSIALYLTQDSSFNSSSHKKYVYMRMSSTSGAIYARLQVDASAVYDNGVVYGYTNIQIGNPLTSIPDGYSVTTSSSKSYTSNGSRDLYFRSLRLNKDGTAYTTSGASRQLHKLTINVNVPSTSHSPSITTNSSYYMPASATESAAKSAAATAMNCSTDKLTKISEGAIKGNAWVWFKVTCGGTTKYYYTKTTT